MLHSLPDLEDALPIATAGFAQSAGFEQALRALGQSVARIDGQLFISCRFPILGPVGYCAKPAHIPAAILSGASPQGMAHVLINAATPAQGATLARAGFLRLAKPRHSLSVPLTQNTAEMVARLHPKWRAARKTALQRGAVARIRPFYTPRDGWLLAAEAAQRKRNHYDGIALALVAEIGRSKAQTLLYICERMSRQAALVFSLSEHEAAYHIGWRSADCPYGSHQMLLFAAMEYAAKRAQHFDLGLSEADSLGLARFKRGTGATLLPLGGTWALSRALAPLHRLARQTQQPRAGGRNGGNL